MLMSEPLLYIFLSTASVIICLLRAFSAENERWFQDTIQHWSGTVRKQIQQHPKKIMQPQGCYSKCLKLESTQRNGWCGLTLFITYWHSPSAKHVCWITCIGAFPNFGERTETVWARQESHGHGETPTCVQNTGPLVAFKAQSSPHFLGAHFPTEFGSNSEKKIYILDVTLVRCKDRDILKLGYEWLSAQRGSLAPK